MKNKMIYRNLVFLFLLFTGIISYSQKPDLELVPGSVVTHSPASSGIMVGSPSIEILPSGEYIVSLSYSSVGNADRGKVHNSGIFISKDRGQTWEFVTKIKNQRWATIFYHRDALYLLGTYKAFGNATIRKSTDKGKTWTKPVDEKTGLLAKGRYHCAPVPLVFHDGKIWRAMEFAPRKREFKALMMSIPEDADLMNAENWAFSEQIPYDEKWYNGKFLGWLEGNAVLTKENEIVNILRCNFTGEYHSIAAKIDISPDGKNLEFEPEKGFIDFPGAAKKFTIRYDPETKKYWTLVNWVQPAYLKYLENTRAGRIRNTLALTSSTNLEDWIIERIVLFHPDIKDHGFQYVDWLFEGDDLIAVSRTAYDDGLGGAANYHDANYITFHRIKDFRNNFNLELE